MDRKKTRPTALIHQQHKSIRPAEVPPKPSPESGNESERRTPSPKAGIAKSPPEIGTPTPIKLNRVRPQEPHAIPDRA